MRSHDRDNHHKRRSIRLQGYDYSQPGAYFVTVVTSDRSILFDNERFRSAAEDAWLSLASLYDYVTLDEYVIMPNHLHGIIVISDPRRGGSRTAPTGKPLGRIVGAFKTISSKRINEMRGATGLPVWQRNYYEHVIRDDRDLAAVRQYIVDNPACWADDPENKRAVREPPLH